MSKATINILLLLLITTFGMFLAEPAAADSQELAITTGPVTTGDHIVVWGITDSGAEFVPPGLNDIKAIGAGHSSNLVVKGDGTVVAWGENYYGQTDVPAGLTNVKAVDGGTWHSIALKEDGTVVAWGRNQFGQTNIPAGLNNVKAIAAGSVHNLALKEDGTVVAWGANDKGQADVPPGLTNVIAISANGWQSLALKSNGTVVAWGFDYEGANHPPVGLNNVKAIAAGTQYNLALKQDGTVVGWGNIDSYNSIPAGLNNVKAIAAGNYINYALKTDGTLVGWGAQYVPNQYSVSGLKHVEKIVAGTWHAMAVLNQQILTNLTVSPATGTYGSSVNLTATLKRANGAPVAGKLIEFKLRNNVIGTVVTNGQGIASLTNVSLNGINAGTYATGVSASFAGGGGYTSSINTANLTVNKAPANLQLNNLIQTYTGTPKIVATVTQPAGLNVAFTFQQNGQTVQPVNAGTYNVIATIIEQNYQGSTTGTLVINQAQATITLGNLVQYYSGMPKTVSVTTSPAGAQSSVSLSYFQNGHSVSQPIQIGDYSVKAQLISPNYVGTSATGLLKILPNPPVATTLEVKNIVPGGGNFEGLVNPNGGNAHYYFQIASAPLACPASPAQPGYGPLSGTAAHPVNLMVSSLTPNTYYYYRLVATNEGGTACGEEKTFRTAMRVTDFNIFTFGNLNLDATAHRIAGRVATGGDTTIQNFGLALDVPGNQANLLVGGTLTLVKGQVNGDSFYGGFYYQSGVNQTYGVAQPKFEPVELTNTLGYVTKISEGWYNTPVNGTTSFANQTLTLTGNQATLNVFRLEPQQLSQVRNLVLQMPPMSTVVINVVGDSSVSITDLTMNLNGFNSNRLVFNLPQATSLSVIGSEVQGTIWAPQANSTFEHTTLRGMLLTNTLSGSQTEFKYVPFVGLPAF